MIDFAWAGPLKSTARALVFALCCALGVVACSSDESGHGGRARETPDTNGGAGGDGGAPDEVVLEAPAKVYSNVHVLPDAVMAQASIDGDTIVFPSSIGAVVTELRAGDVIVSSYEDGFIRVVESTESGGELSPQSLRPQAKSGGVLRLLTRLGSFLDVFSDLDATLTHKFDALSANASGERLAGNDDANLTLTQAKLSLTPSVTFRMRIAGGAVERMSMELADTLMVSEAVKASAKRKVTWSYSKKLWTSPTLHLRFVLGLVPIVSTLYFDLKADANAKASGVASLEAGSSCTSSLGARVAYEPGTGAYAEPLQQFSCQPIWQQQLQANLSAGVGLTLGGYWDFFALGGLSLSFRGGAEASAQLCPAPGEWDIDLTRTATAGARFEPFGLSLGKVSTKLFDDTVPLADGTLDVLSSVCVSASDGSGGETGSTSGSAGADAAEGGGGGVPNGEGGSGGVGQGAAGEASHPAGGDEGGGTTAPRGHSRQDPHFRTFDGVTYDMQAAGEFLLAAPLDDPAGDLIQTRQEPLAVDLCPHVTLNTAIAARIAGAQLGIYAGDPPKVVLDGSPVSLLVGAKLALGTGGTLARVADNVWEARWGKDARLQVRADPYAHQQHLDVVVWPPVAWRGRVHGLLGDYDGQAANDIRLNDGTVLSDPMSWNDFYLRYVEELRVHEQDSLFQYEPGQSSATFRSTALPGKPSVPATLPTAARDQAAGICQGTGVSDPTLLDACTMDVACSGGDASQANWITDVDPGVASRKLAGGPERVELALTFAATTGSYADTADLAAACRTEFGPDAALADWLDVKGIPTASLDAWRAAVGLVDYDADELYLANAGQEMWSAPRHYFIVWHDHRPVSGFLVHDDLDDHELDLGSWYGWTRRVLCRVCSDGACGTALGSEPSHPATSCSDIVAAHGERGDGKYWIKPPGASAAFEVDCDMTTAGGGFTRLTDAVASTLDATSKKRYLYAIPGAYYLSPVTTLAWSWSAGQELVGTYRFFDGTLSGSLDCSGSSEQPSFGIGCSSGAGSTLKVLPWVTEDSTSGSCTVCQDLPGAFQPGACHGGVSVFVRLEPQ